MLPQQPGGPFKPFPTTIWGEILAAGDPANPQCRGMLERLVQNYWTPVFAYVRVAWHKSEEDATDLTQAFFAHVLEKNYLSKVRPERGSFRGYLKTALKHFLIDADRANRARRPDGVLFSLEAAPGELDRVGPVSPGDTPERAFDREWFRCLMDAAIEALRAHLEGDGKKMYFEAFRAYCLEPHTPQAASRRTTLLERGPDPAPTYREVAERLRLKESDVRNYLSHCRGVLRQILRERIRDYVDSEESVERELEEVLRG